MGPHGDGKWGHHVGSGGPRLYAFLRARDLCSVQGFYQKKNRDRDYWTWQHPNDSTYTRTEEFLVVKRRDLASGVSDASVCKSFEIAAAAATPSKKKKSKVEREREAAGKRAKVFQTICGPFGGSRPSLAELHLHFGGDSGDQKTGGTRLMRKQESYAAHWAGHVSPPWRVCFSEIARPLYLTLVVSPSLQRRPHSLAEENDAHEPVLKALKSGEKPKPGWFTENEGLMRVAIEKRDQQQKAYNENPNAKTKASLKKARRQVKIAKNTATNRWKATHHEELVHNYAVVRRAGSKAGPPEAPPTMAAAAAERSP